MQRSANSWTQREGVFAVGRVNQCANSCFLSVMIIIHSLQRVTISKEIFHVQEYMENVIPKLLPRHWLNCYCHWILNQEAALHANFRLGCWQVPRNKAKTYCVTKLASGPLWKAGGNSHLDLIDSSIIIPTTRQ